MNTTIKQMVLGLAILGGAALAGGLPAAHAGTASGSATIHNSSCPTSPNNPCIQVEQGLTIASKAISPLDTLVISGDVQAAPGTMTLTFTDSTSGVVFYTATTMSTAMASDPSSDYFGYSQFRFAVPDYLLGSRPNWVNVAVSRQSIVTIDHFTRVFVWPSNVVQVYGQTSHVNIVCDYTVPWNAADGIGYLDGVDIAGRDLQPSTGVSVSILQGFDVNPADPRTILWGPVSATTSSAAHPTFSVHVSQDMVSRLSGTTFQVNVSYVGRDGTYMRGPFTGFGCPASSAQSTQTLTIMN